VLSLRGEPYRLRVEAFADDAVALGRRGGAVPGQGGVGIAIGAVDGALDLQPVRRTGDAADGALGVVVDGGPVECLRIEAMKFLHALNRSRRRTYTCIHHTAEAI
jgi:hypothetical protein